MNQELIKQLMNQELSELSLFINNNCNLKCRHCYVGTKNEEEDVKFEEWKLVVEEALSLGVKIFGIVGKEPLLSSEKTFALIKEIKEKEKSAVVGIVTNGTLLENYLTEISESDLDYIDISIDGTKEGHDYIRGEGNFEKTLSALRKLIKVFPREKIFLSITLTNKTDLVRIIQFFDKEGIVNFVVSPFLTFDHNDKGLMPNEEDYFETFFKELEDLSTDNKINVLMKTDYNELDLVKFFIDKGYIDLDDLQQDKERGILFTEHKINNLTLCFNFLPFNTELIREVRITSDGYVLRCMDQGHSDYKNRSVGNIKNNSLKEILENKNTKEVISEKLEENLKEIKEKFKTDF